MKHIVGIVVIAALALSGCGGNDEKVEIGVPAQSVATTSTTFKDSLVCIQDAESPLPWGDEAMREPPCPSPSTATVPEQTIPSCTEIDGVQETVQTAIEAFRAQAGDARAEPTMQDLVDAGFLQAPPRGVSYTWENGKQVGVESCLSWDGPGSD